MKTTTKTVTRTKPTRGGKKRMYRKRTKVASRVHMIKRVGLPITVDNSGSLGDPKVTQSAGGSFGIGVALPEIFQSGWGVGGAHLFRLSAVQDVSDLINLFDRYKITGVKLDFMYQQNVSIGQDVDDGAGLQATALPIINYAYDFDDSNPPALLSTVQVKGYCKRRILSANKPFSVFIRPRLLKGAIVDPDANTLAHTSERPTWLDVASPDVRHYGLKFWLSNFPAGYNIGEGTYRANAQLTIQPTYYLALKDTQ